LVNSFILLIFLRNRERANEIALRQHLLQRLKIARLPPAYDSICSRLRS
jgi:hypothetical protein